MNRSRFVEVDIILIFPQHTVLYLILSEVQDHLAMCLQLRTMNKNSIFLLGQLSFAMLNQDISTFWTISYRHRCQITMCLE